MCQYSLEGFKTRDAKEGETLYCVQDHSGAFTDKASQVRLRGNTPKLVCVKEGQKITIEHLAVMGDDYYYRRHGMTTAIKKLVGKHHVVTLRQQGYSHGGNTNGDSFVFANGFVLSSYLVTSPIYVGERAEQHKMFRGRKQFDHHITRWPPTKVGVAAINAAVDEAIKSHVEKTPTTVVVDVK